MHISIQAVADIFGVNNQLVEMAFKGVEDSDVNVRPENKANSLQWLAGHITGSRYMLANILGLDMSYPWEELFNRGVKVTGDESYPPLDDMKKVWAEITAQLTDRMETITEEELDEECRLKFPTSYKTKVGAVSFFALHELCFSTS